MFRLVQEEYGIVFYSQVLYRSQVRTLLKQPMNIRNRFPRMVRMEMRHSYTRGLGDWVEVPGT